MSYLDNTLFRNSASGCSRAEQNGLCQLGNKKFKHGCSKVDGTRICWKDHKEADH